MWLAVGPTPISRPNGTHLAPASPMSSLEKTDNLTRFIEEAATAVTVQNKWYAWDLTKAVRHWVKGSWKNYGVILISDAEARPDSGKDLESSENVDVPHRPKLVVRFALAVEPSGKLATTWGQIRER